MSDDGGLIREINEAYDDAIREGERLRARCICGTPHNPAIEKVAAHFGFTYEQAYDYVIVIGCAYAIPARETGEPGE